MKKILLLLCLTLSTILHGQDLKALDKYIEQVRKDWNVPGLSVAIVKDGKVVLAKGYGVREAGKPEPADEHTLYAIASNSKAFTSACIAKLVDEGKLKWDDKVTDHLPWFKLHDPWITAHITIRDLLCHRVGFRTFSGDLLWNSTTYSRKEIVQRARYLKPTYDFRAGYGYSNIMFITAGEVIEAVTGKSWEAYVRENFFGPLNMNESVMSTNDLKDRKDVAAPHVNEKGVQKPIAWENWDNMGPAGGIIASVNDLSSWLKMQLNHGTLNDHKFFSEETQQTMWEAHNALPVSGRSKAMYPSIHFRAAALGWFTFDYKGAKVVNHGGGYIGMLSQVVMVPEKNLGFVILTNAMEGALQPIIYKILDSYLGGEQTDWNAKALERKKEYEERLADQEEAEPIETLHSLPLQAYTGTYTGDLYGDATVTLKDGKLHLQMEPTPAFHAPLTHKHYDTFNVYFADFPYLPEGTVTFILNADGLVEEMKIFVPNNDFWFEELEFKKKPAEKSK
ncbi:MAG: serine hydrolase [Flavobacteriales bacterium]|nr:serine hydrolase [Flavobacteriales bacterium]